VPSALPPALLLWLLRVGEDPEVADKASRVAERFELTGFGLTVTVATWALLLCLNGWCLLKLVGRPKKP